MLRKIVLLLAVLFLFELWVLIRIGQWIGAFETILLLVVSGLVGACLVRHESGHTGRIFEMELMAGRIPGQAIAEGFLLLVAGVLLAFPGVVSDALALPLLIRPTRRLIARLWRQRIRRRFAGSEFGPPPDIARDGFAGDEIIDGDFIDVDAYSPQDRRDGRSPEGHRQLP